MTRSRHVAAVCGWHPGAVEFDFLPDDVVLFELPTPSPGFTVDEPIETLGEHLTLPPDYEQHREKLEQVLTPLPDTRQWRRAGREAPAS